MRDEVTDSLVHPFAVALLEVVIQDAGKRAIYDDYGYLSNRWASNVLPYFLLNMAGALFKSKVSQRHFVAYYREAWETAFDKANAGD